MLKKNKSSLILGLSVFIFVLCTASSCLKDKIVPSKHQVYKGRLMYSCGVPAKNETFTFNGALVGMGHSKWHEKCQTDSNGYFKFINKHNTSAGWISKCCGSNLLTGLPNKEVNDLGKVYTLGQTISFVIYLDVKKKYTSNDTLHFYNWNYPQDGSETWIKKVSGPFESGIIDTVFNATYMSTLSYGKSPKMDVSYYINDYSNVKDAYVKTPFCLNNSSPLPKAVLVIK